MLAVFKREFKSFFQNVIGWVFIAAMVFVAALYFRVYNLSGGYSDIRYVFINLLMIMVFAIPVLVMRSLPEERKNKIDQLTLTSPISIGKLVTGKYLAMISVLGITTLAIGSFIVFIAAYTNIDWGINLLAMLGFFLYGCASIAVCLFVTSFTESQVLAAITSIVLSFIIYMISGIQYLLNATENNILGFISKCIGILNFSDKFDTNLNGVFDIKGVVYFVSVIIVFLFLTTQVIQKRRFTTSVKNISLQAFSVSMIAIVIAVAVLGNLAFASLPTKYTEFDVTKQRLFTLSDATKELVKTINDPVKIYAYVAENSKDATIDRILQEYRELNKNISIEYVDPQMSPKFYQKYTDSTPSLNSLFMETGTKSKYVDANDMFLSDYSYNEESGSYDTVVSYDIEGRITAGLSYLIYGTSGVIYNLTGHDEQGLDAGYMDAINKANLDVEDIALISQDIPDDCQLILINAPRSDFSSDDADKIIKYVDNGGAIMISLDVSDDLANRMPNFKKLLDYFDVEVHDGLVVDQANSYQDPFYILPNVSSNEITDGVYGRKNVWMPYAKAMTSDGDDVVITPILKSSDVSYNKVDVENAKTYDKIDGDEDGPFYVALLSTKNDKGKAYIVGSPFLFSDTVDQATSNASATIFMNIVNGNITEDTTFTAVVPARNMDSEPFIISNFAGIIIFLVVMIVIPFVLIIIGLVIWLKRRKK